MWARYVTAILLRSSGGSRISQTGWGGGGGVLTTAHVRSSTGGYVFTGVCLLTGERGTPSPSHNTSNHWSGWQRHRENRELGSYFFQTGKTQGILL